MNETTLRLAAARRRLTKSDISKRAELDTRTITKLFDEIPDDVIVGSLRQVAAALGLVLVIQFKEPEEE